MSKPVIELVVAATRNRVIGLDGRMPWHLPADLAHFKALTLNHSVIMGRKTFASIGRALPKRRNLVLSRQASDAEKTDVVEWFSGLEAALEACEDEPRVFVIGGGQLYQEALPLAARVYLTRVETELEGDTFFPRLDPDQWQVRTLAQHAPDAANALPLTFLCYERNLLAG